MVTIDEVTLRREWLLGSVLSSNKGTGLVRSAKVRTAKSELVRPITKLCLLEKASLDCWAGIRPFAR